MKILKFLLLFIFFVAHGYSYAQVSQKQSDMFVNGTQIILTPPADFIPAKQFPGYQLESRGSSIMVTDVPGPFAETTAGFSNTFELKKRGMSVLNKREVRQDAHNGLLLKVEQKAYEVDFLKWIFILGDDKETVIITATFPKIYEAELSEKLKASILTASWDRGKKVIPTESLNFTVEEKGELKFSKRFSNILLYTKNGIFPSKDVNDPFFIVGQSFSKTAIVENEKYAKARVLQIAQIKDVKIEQSNKITIDNLNGYEIVARGENTESGQQGLVSNVNRQANLELFKRMARTFKRTA